MIKKLFTVVALLCATTVSLQAQTPDWYKNGENYFKAVNKNTEHNFTMTVKATIDGVRCDDAFEIGVFCGNECRLSKPFYSNLLEYYGYYSNLTVKGEKGETISFRLYDHRNKVEVKVASLPEVEFKSDAVYGSFDDGLYDLAFNGSTTHRGSLIVNDATDLPFSGTQYGITADGIACSYTRNAYLDGGFETIVLPFDADITSIKDAGFVFEKFEGFGKTTIKFVELDENEHLQAGVPYLFRYSGTPSDGHQEIKFVATMDQVEDKIVETQGWTGTFKRMEGNEIAGKYILNIEGNQMQEADETAWLNPYHGYLVLPADVNASALSVAHRGNTADIDAPDVQKVPEAIYDLYGRKLMDMPRSGIVIINNKKVLIK